MSYHRSNLATLSQATYNYLKANGYDANDIFSRAGMNPDKRTDSDHRYGIHETMRMWRIALNETKRACLVYEVVDFIEPWMMHAVGHAWISSHNLLAALQRLERYHRMLSTNVYVRLEKLQGAHQLSAGVLDPYEHPATDATLAFILEMCRRSYGDDLTPLQVQLTRLEPMEAESLEAFFRCDVAYGCDENILIFSSDDLGRKLSSANPVVAAAMDDVIVDYLAKFDASDIANKVRQIVASYLVHGEPDKQMIADELNMSARTLQRRLDEQQTSVKDIIDETRHQLALEYLSQDHLSIKEVAFSLGFNDASNFSRAFKRWQGMTPKAFRKAA